MTDTVYIDLEPLNWLLNDAEAAGVDPQDVMDNVGGVASSPSFVATQSDKITLADFFRIESEIARRLDDLTAHQSERKLTFETGAFVTSQVSQSTTLADAIHNLARSFNMMHGGHYNSVRMTKRRVSLIIDDSEFPYTAKDNSEIVYFTGESMLIKVHCLLDSISQGKAGAALKRVSVKRVSPPVLPEHLKFWAAPISFSQPAYELSFDHELAHAPISISKDVDLSSEGLFSRVIAYLESDAVRASEPSTKSRAQDLIREGMTQQGAIASRLEISVATLRRRLEDEQTSFRDLVNQYRMEEAITLLQNGLSVTEAAEKLDYSDVRAFNRAFKRWKGVTPSVYASEQTG